jgi:hypothetical protein
MEDPRLHSMCEDCWRERSGARAPIRVNPAILVTCCWCGEPTLSGIRFRLRQWLPNCHHHHPQHPAAA